MRWGQLGDGHVSARDPILTDHFWLLDWGIPFGKATVDGLVLVGPDGRVIDADGNPTGAVNTAGYNIHAPVLAARPDAVSAAHTHTSFGTPWSANVQPFRAISQESCAFVFDQALFDDEEVEVLSYDGGKRIAAALGDRKLCILRNHGLLTAGGSVEEAVGWFVMAERVAEVHVKAPNGIAISDDVRGDRRRDPRATLDWMAPLPVATAQRRRRPQRRGSAGRGLSCRPTCSAEPSIRRCSKTASREGWRRCPPAGSRRRCRSRSTIRTQIAMTATKRSLAKAPNARNTPMLDAAEVEHRSRRPPSTRKAACETVARIERHLLHRNGREDDPGDDRRVGVGVDVACEAPSLDRVGSPLLGARTRVVPGRSTPTTAARRTRRRQPARALNSQGIRPSFCSGIATEFPSATITSPSATMMINACRSAKWPARMIHSLPPARIVEKTKIAMPTIQAIVRASPSRNPPVDDDRHRCKIRCAVPHG